jgi:hypothetical protein
MLQNPYNDTNYYKKKTPMTHHISSVDDRKKTQAFDFCLLTGAKTTKSESNVWLCEIHYLGLVHGYY